MKELSTIENALKSGKNIIPDPIRKGILIGGQLTPISGVLQKALFEGMHQEIVEALEAAGQNREEVLTETKEDITIGSEIIQFDKGGTQITEHMKTEINQKMQSFVNEVQRRQNANPPEDTDDMKIALTGYASWDGGNRATNEALALKRAEVIKQYLQSTFPVLTDEFFGTISGQRQDKPVQGKNPRDYQSVHIDASRDKKETKIDQDHKDRRERRIGQTN